VIAPTCTVSKSWQDSKTDGIMKIVALVSVGIVHAGSEKGFVL
jgi:hypothetical protein